MNLGNKKPSLEHKKLVFAPIIGKARYIFCFRLPGQTCYYLILYWTACPGCHGDPIPVSDRG